MKRTDSADKEFDRNFDSVMKRLLNAGIIESYAMNRTPCVVWSKKYSSPMGGRAAFLGLAMLLSDVCRERPLSADEQAIIQIIRQAEFEDESPEA